MGILNSKVINFYLKSICPFVRGGYYEYNSQYMGQVPVSSNTKYRHELSKSVMILLKNHKKILSNKIQESEKNEIEKKIISEEVQVFVNSMQRDILREGKVGPEDLKKLRKP